MKVAFFITLAFFLWVLWAATHVQAATIFPSQYDDQIRSAVKQYWPDYPDYLDWKAELFQESRLDPNAKSSAGAIGLAQFLPGTWGDVERALALGAVPRNIAGPAILGGAYYLETLRRQWRSGPRSMDDRQRLAQASFNAGIGSLLKAQSLCDGNLDYAAIVPCLPDVTGQSNAKQTTDYVTMIAKWRALMVGK